MRILQVARQFYPSVGGVENAVANLSSQLIKDGHLSDVITLNRLFHRLDFILPAYEKIKGVNVFRVPFWGYQRFFLAPGVLKFLNNYDLIHIHNVDTFINLLVFSKPWYRKPLILTTHGGFFHTNWARRLKTIYFNTILRTVIPAVDVVIADSEHDRKLFASLCPKIVLISNGVDFKTFSLIKKTIQPNLLVYIGRCASNKRIDNLIRAFAKVASQIADASLVIIGANSENIVDELKSLAAQLGVEQKVIFTGYLDDSELYEYLSKAHVFVSASEYEAFGISVIEAMSTGTVPVLNDIEPFRAFVKPRENGYLVDFKNADQASSMLIEALSLEYTELYKMGIKAQNIARTYSCENVAYEVEELYCKVLRL